ncbi:6635_t:CDS:1, partial [Funneliformis geosporum]
EVGGFFRGLAFDAAIDGVSGGAIEGVKLSKGAAEVIKVGCETFSKVSDEVDKINGEYIPTPDPQTTLLFAKNIKNIF